MKSLYRRYRPLKLEDVVGQEQVTGPLKNALEQKKISHAYLFTGPRGTGKTSVARIFAHEINGFNYELEDEYVDIVEIDGASNRGIDDIREIREKAAIRPSLGKYKVYIIDEVHMLTKEAFNALLKTLEEPPEHVVFIMATTDPQKVPVTILSRAQSYNFGLVDADIIFNHLQKISDLEKFQIEPDALKLIVKRGGGSFRDSLSLLDQISTASGDLISKDTVEKIMGLPHDEKIRDLIKSHENGDTAKITELLRELFSAGVKAEIIAEEMIREIIESPTTDGIRLLGKLPEVKAPFADARLLYILAGDNASISPTRPVLKTSLNISPKTAVKAREEPPKQVASSTIKTTSNNSSNSAFDWETFLEEVREVNDIIFAQLKGVGHEVKNGTLFITPNKSFAKVILGKPNNISLMSDIAGMKVSLGDENPKNSNLKTKISDIMGGEVQEYGGGSPF
ncbi:DNA polymerase III subunit gamma/tau [Candidatus Saccharibacteria bacterium]|nr:DNA polymerase III subunit gamma/tau [Candidatus Saccharibacteria bacterium]